MIQKPSETNIFNPFAGPEILKVLPTTEPQTEIWLSCMLGGDDANRSYNESVSLKLTGALDVAILERAIDFTIKSHEAMRSSFSADGSKIIIYKSLPSNLVYDNISELDQNEKYKYIQLFHETEAHSAFNLISGPLFRFSLFKLGAEDYYFTITAHHILCDGWSLGILLQTLSAAYNDYFSGNEMVNYTAVSFTQYVLNRIDFYKSEQYQKIEAYWLNQYSGRVPVLDMPTDFQRPFKRSYKSRRDDFELNEFMVASVKNIANRSQSSFVTTLLACFEVLLHKYTKQIDIVLGLPSAGQSVNGMYHLVGHCVNLLPLRSYHDPNQQFQDYLKSRKQGLLNDYDHQEFTFGSLLKKLDIVRDPSRIPLVPVVFNIDLGMDDKVQFMHLKHKLFYNPRAFESFEIFLNISGHENGSMHFEWSYNTQLYKPASIKHLMDCFIQLIQQVAQNPEIRINDLLPELNGEILDYIAPLSDDEITSLLPTGNDYSEEDQPQIEAEPISQIDADVPEMAISNAPLSIEVGNDDDFQMDATQLQLLQIIKVWNNTKQSYPNKALHELVEEMTALHPDQPAIYFDSVQTTYKQLNNRANQIAKYLVASGVELGDRVAVCIERSPLMIAALLAVLKAGAAYVPIDQELPSERIQYILEDAQVKVCATSMHCASKINTTKTVIRVDDTIALTRFLTDNLGLAISNKSAANVIYTSGSTGKPKGVVVTHKNMVNVLWSLIKWPGLEDRERMLAVTTMSFDIAGVEMFLPLIAGVELVLVSSDVAKDAFELLKVLKAQKITWMQATPATYKMLIAAGWEEKLPIRLITCGEQLSRDLANKLLDRCLKLFNLYGPTETTIFSTGIEVSKQDEITIGKPLHNTSLYILDEDGYLCPPGHIGELYIAGDGVTNGYFNKQELTDQKFVPDRFSDHNKALMFKTGDVAKYADNGNVYCLGRIDHQVKIRGYRIELEEIEYTMLQLSGIKDVVVVAKDDIMDEKRLVAYIVPDKPIADTSIWSDALRKTLPAYMVPSVLMQMDALPLSPSGKVDRKALPEPAHTPPPVAKAEAPAKALTEQEQILHTIWCEALALNNIAITDDFFKLGGHSLSAIQVMATVEKKMGKKLPITSLFEYPTIAQFATLLQQSDTPKLWKSLVPIKVSGKKPPLYIVHGNGLTVMVFQVLAQYLDLDQPVYGLQARGLKDVKECQNNMVEIAATYIEEILEQNPHGPYCLSGYSFGGFVAFEMARQLQAKGKVVNMVGIFDTYAGNADRYDGAISKMTNKVLRQFPKMKFILSSLAKNPQEAIAYQQYISKKKIGDMVGAEVELDEEKNRVKLPNEDIILEQHDKAVNDYRLQESNFKITLFRAKERVYFLEDMVYLGWKPYAKNGVEVHEVPGDHKTMFFPPHVQELANAVQSALDTCNHKK